VSGVASERDALRPVDGPVRPIQLPWRTRFWRALQLLVIFVAVPIGAGMLLGPQGAGFATVLGAMQVLWSSLSNGRRLTGRVLPLMLLASVLGALTTPGPLWVLLLVVLAAASGLATLWGAGIAVSMATLLATVVPAIGEGDQLLALIAFLCLGAGYGWLMGARFGAPNESPAAPATLRSALTITVSLASAVGVAGAVVLLTDLSNATWAVTAVVALGIPTPGLTERLMLQRMAGQLGASAIVVVVALMSTNPIVLSLAALVCLQLFFMSFGRPVAEQIAYLSAFFMLPAVAATSPTSLAAQNIGYNLLGVAILGLVLVVLRVVRKDRD